MPSNIDEELDKLLIPIIFGEDGMTKPDGSSLIDQIVYSQKSKLAKSRNEFKQLINSIVLEVIDTDCSSLRADVLRAAQRQSLQKRLGKL